MTAAACCRQGGVALVLALIWLMVVSLLATSGAQMVLQDRKALTNLRDREVAFQSAEAGLRDGESDIVLSQRTAVRQRTAGGSDAIGRDLLYGFPLRGQPLCHSGAGEIRQGLCRTVGGDASPAWLLVDLAGSPAGVPVPYGRFTGRSMQTGSGALPARLPQYVIELVRSEMIIAGADSDAALPEVPQPSELWYRITAIGFGVRSANQVVLQSYFRVLTSAHESTPVKIGDRSQTDAQAAREQRSERIGWREIANWQELHARADSAHGST